MGTQHSGSIKGLGIAVTILSALNIVACVLILGITLTAGTLAVLGGSSDSAFIVRGNSEVQEYELDDFDDSDIDAGIGSEVDSIDDVDFISTDDSSDAATGLGVALAVLVPLTIVVILKDVIALVAGIVGIRGAYLPERLGRIFGWNLAAAIISGLSCNFVTMVLCIVACVFASKDRSAA